MKKVFNFYFLLFICVVVLGAIYYYKSNVDSTLYKRIISDSLVTDGSGLYSDNVMTGATSEFDFASKYYFKGESVNNYFFHDGVCFRIVNIANNNSIKVMYTGVSKGEDCSSLEDLRNTGLFSSNANNNFLESDINELFVSFLENNKLFDKDFNYSDIIVDAKWFVSGIKMSGNKLSENIEYERGLPSGEDAIIDSKIGLISITDYLKAGCQKSVYDAYKSCASDNFLFNGKNYFTMSNVLWDKTNVYTVTNGVPKPMLSNKIVETDLTDEEKLENRDKKYYIFPSFYINGELIAKGDGSSLNPYRIK